MNDDLKTKYLFRLVIIYLIQLIFKYFDQSFSPALFAFRKRGIFFAAFFVIYGLLAWEGAVGIQRLLDHFTRGRISFHQRMVVLTILLLIYGVFISFSLAVCYHVLDVWLFGYHDLWGDFSYLDYDLNVGLFLFYCIVLLINGILFYFKHWQETQLQNEQLEKETIRSQYEALKNQIDPHFFFNSLSVLTTLVYEDPEVAANYITQLSKVYRNILEERERNLLTLEEEFTLLNSYIYLMKIRHGDSIRFEVRLSEKTLKISLVPHNTLQLLVENAIKHNQCTTEQPLVIEFLETPEHLVVRNNRSPRLLMKKTTGIGLENIRRRFALISNREPIIEKTTGYFTVKLPLLQGSAEQYQGALG